MRGGGRRDLGSSLVVDHKVSVTLKVAEHDLVPRVSLGDRKRRDPGNEVGLNSGKK